MAHIQASFFGDRADHFSASFLPRGRNSSFGVMICGPIGQEDIRTQKTVVQIAREFSSLGLPALTFDYYGTGDSAGRYEDVTLATCESSIVKAAAHLRSTHGVKRLIVLCVRAGGFFLSEACKTIDPELVIFWHPIVTGKKYVKDIRQQHRSWLMGSFVSKDAKFDGKEEVLGFLYDSKFIKELRNTRLDLSDMARGRRCLLVTTNDHRKHDFCSFTGIDFLESKYDNFWKKSGIEKAFVPMHDIKSISDWVRDFTASNKVAQ